MARSKTARQKFQRAFAQALLCPHEDLVDYVGTENPSGDDLSAAARHFRVSEQVVRTILVNKDIIGRERLEDQVEAA
jgi:Zn-dependent peptidase ImmA (M78 family)